MPLFLLLVLAASGPSVAVAPFNAQPGSAADLARVASGTLAADLAKQGVDVVQVASGERDAPTGVQSCGARADTCTPALADNLGVSSFLLGELAQQEDGTLHLTVRLISPGGQLLRSERVDVTTAWALIDELHRRSAALAAELSSRFRVPLEVHPKRAHWAPWLIGSGAVAIFGGVLLEGLAASDVSQLLDHRADLRPMEAFDVASSGRRKQQAGIGLLVVGAAALGTGLVFYFTSQTHAPRLTAGVSAGSGGAGLTIGGTLP